MCALFLLAGYLLKAQCLQPWVDFRQYERLCYNDIQPLYGLRGVAQGTFPYIGGSLHDGELANGAIEYPVLTGVFMWASGLVVDDANRYLTVSALLLAPFGLLAAYHLGRMAGRRALLWAAAPALILYSFHNWDLLVVAAFCAAAYSWTRGSPGWAAAWLGVGGALKMYPLFFLAPLALERWRARDRRGAVASVGVGAATFAALNLSFVVRNFEGWVATYRFHESRPADFNSIWHWAAPHLSIGGLNLLTAALTAGSFALALGVGWWRARREGGYPFLQVSGAMLAAFLLWNKVHSPQYALWIMPFFALLRVGVLLWAAYSVADMLFYAGIFRWFYDTYALGVDDTLAKQVMLVALWGRAALLGAVFAIFLRARPAPPEADLLSAPLPSHPPPIVERVGESVPAPS
ncbi:MAG: glycosyltransferase 87 family protein [Actinomycetota bacterium]